MPWDLVVWLVIVVAWLVFEIVSLRRDDDSHHPFTYWVRNLFNLKRGPFSLGWWAVGALLLWLAWHFLIEGVFL